MRICNTLDSTFYFYGTSPIILTGDNRNLVLGPNNSNAPDLKSHLKAANIPISNEHLDSFDRVLFKSETNCYERMKPADYDLLVLPPRQEEEHGNSSQNKPIVLAPETYLKELEERNKYYSDLKGKIARSNLNP